MSYKPISGDTVLPFAYPDAPTLKQAGFVTRHLWVMPYHADERYPVGNYPDQHLGSEGLPIRTVTWLPSFGAMPPQRDRIAIGYSCLLDFDDRTLVTASNSNWKQPLWKCLSCCRTRRTSVM